MFQRYLWILLIVGLLSLSTALADFQVVLTPVDDSIKTTETASFRLYIVNLGDVKDSYDFTFSSDGRWSIETDPLSHLSGVSIDSTQSQTTKVLLTPTSTLNSGKYTFPFIVTSEKTDEAYDSEFIFTITGDVGSSGYLPSINIDVDIASKIDPREDNVLIVSINNRNLLDIPDLLIDIKSSIYSTQRLVSLSGLEQITEDFVIPYEPNQEPMVDMFEISVVADDYTFGPLRKEIEIISYSDFDQDLVEGKEFLKRTETHIFTNKGNIEDSDTFILETSFFSQLFTRTNPKAEVVKEDGKRYYQWEIILGSGESSNIILTRNFRTFAGVILLILIGILAYYLFRSSVITKKQARILKMEKHSGISKMKVLLHVKNRTGKVIDHVLVTDRIPHIAEVIKDFEVGTLKPEKLIKHKKEGVLLRWTFNQLEPYEERIITYMVRTKLDILGGFSLPSAMVKFKNKKGKFVKAFSNKAKCK